jgi:hypothetical protein
MRQPPSATSRSGGDQDDGLEDELLVAGAMGDTAWTIGDDGQRVQKATMVKSMFQSGCSSSDRIRRVMGMSRYMQCTSGHAGSSASDGPLVCLGDPIGLLVSTSSMCGSAWNGSCLAVACVDRIIAADKRSMSRATVARLSDIRLKCNLILLQLRQGNTADSSSASDAADTMRQSISTGMHPTARHCSLGQCAMPLTVSVDLAEGGAPQCFAWSEKDLEDALQAAHLGRFRALPFACTGGPLPYSAGQSFAFICQADDVTAVASQGQLACRYPNCGTVVKASDLRAHVGVHMSTNHKTQLLEVWKHLLAAHYKAQHPGVLLSEADHTWSGKGKLETEYMSQWEKSMPAP